MSEEPFVGDQQDEPGFEEDLNSTEYQGSLEQELNDKSIATTERKPVFWKYFLAAEVILNIVNGSIWGVLARKGIEVLTVYPGAYLGGVVWANFGACLIMGMTVKSERLWMSLLESNLYANKGAIPIYIGISGGFCGTFSSFSSAIIEMFTKATNTDTSTYAYPTAGYGVMEFLSVMIAQFGISMVGLTVGRHILLFLDPHLPQLNQNVLRIVSLVSSFIGLAAFIVSIILIGVLDRGDWREWMFSIFFAPFGALLRFYVGRILNPKLKSFPLGTFTVNVMGSMLLAIFEILMRGKSSSREGYLVTNEDARLVLTGLIDGFCGALTTVSTFVVELDSLNEFHAYRYFSASIGLAFIFAVVIMGSYNWKVGFMY